MTPAQFVGALRALCRALWEQFRRARPDRDRPA